MKPIRTPADHAAALNEIARLIGAASGTPEADRLEVLGVLVADYERRSHEQSVDSVDVLTVAMKIQGRSQADLAAVLGSRARASEVLSRRRSLSGDMIDRLHSAWGLPRRLLGMAKAPRKTSAPARALSVAGAAALLGAAAVAGTLGWAARGLSDVAPVVARAKLNSDLSSVPSYVVQAFVAAQDQRFLAHAGYDPRAIVQASLQNLVHGRSRIEGGSTVTQQVVKAALLQGERPSLRRKIREMILAQRLERALTKDQITALYLDEVYLGGGTFGIEAAAERYFDREAAELTVAQAAYLAALVNAPDATRFDKKGNEARAVAGRNRVLDRMAKDGYLTMAARNIAAKELLFRKPS